MAHDSNLSPKDLRLWEQRAPRAAWWFGVSDRHPFINGGQPVPGIRAYSPPPPYTPACPPAPTLPPAPIMPPAPTMQPAPMMPPTNPPYPPMQRAHPPVLHTLPAYLPTLPAPSMQTFYGGNQMFPGLPGAVQPGVVMPFPPVPPVPIYDVRGQANPTPITVANPLPSRKLNSGCFHRASINTIRRFYCFCPLEAA